MLSTKFVKGKKFVRDGILRVELGELFTKMLGEDGYAGIQVRVTPVKTQVIIKATRPREILGEQGRRIRELTSLVQKRFGFRPEQVDLLAERVENRGLSAMVQAESLRYKLLRGLPVRRACYGVLRNVMESGAKGCEVVVSGKLRAQRAKVMKFKDGYMISSGFPASQYVERAVRTVQMRQGILGVRVRIMLPYDPQGIQGPKIPIPDNVIILPPKTSFETAAPGKAYVISQGPVADCTQQTNVQEEQTETA